MISKDQKIGSYIILFIGCACLGYIIAKQIWGWGTFEPLPIVIAIGSFIFVVIFYKEAKKKKNED